ncbi:hypothetical protein PLACP1_08580 [Planifilum fimeticola]
MPGKGASYATRPFRLRRDETVKKPSLDPRLSQVYNKSVIRDGKRMSPHGLHGRISGAPDILLRKA